MAPVLLFCLLLVCVSADGRVRVKLQGNTLHRLPDDDDVTSHFDAADGFSFKPPPKDLNASAVPSHSKVVWEKFSRWTDFQTKLYHYGTFPPDFQWGVFSSAYQIEGGWNADGKGPSIWDTFTQGVNSIPEGGNGNVACDSYNKLDVDLGLIKELGVTSYRFSISWSRIFPNGDELHPNQPGVDYYDRLIDGLVSMKVAPVVTLYHWDLPQNLQKSGGWESANTITLFEEYAEFCFKAFGDRVKFWITFNDPYAIAWKGHGSGELPPNLKKNPGTVPYKVGKNLLLAHARAYRTYERVYKPTQKGVVSIALNGDWYEPLDVNVPRELEAADRAMQFRLGWFAHPIFRNGDFPEAMKFHVKAKSSLQRLKESRFTTFTEAEKMLIRGSADVFCLNHHTTKLARFSTQALKNPSYEFDWDIAEQELNYPHTGVWGPRAVPWGLRRVLNWIKHEYGDPEVYVTDNAMGTNRELNTDDADRVFFLKSYIDEALKAQSVDGVRLRGYMGAGLMDSFEWLRGYTVGSGLNFVDFTNSTRPRTPKYSHQVYRNIVAQNGFPRGEDETLLHGHFREDMMWGTSTAAYQIEGGWRSDGKGLSIWDTFTHTPLRVKNGDNGDVACDSYNRIEEDVQQLLLMGVKVYRFSISWSRVLPEGDLSNVNEPGVDYYVRLVDALLQAGIQPLVTLYHWDLPQALQDVGGWQNVTVVDRFRDYAGLMFTRIGSKVKFWITFNEPWLTSVLGHGYGNHAPGIAKPDRVPYIVTHNLLKSHAEAWHLYNDNFRAAQNGKISITINYDWAEPRNPNKPEDVEISNRHRQFFLGWFAHPIFRGDYPLLMKQIVQERSLAAGLTESRLPEFTPAEVQRINGTHDFFGLNHYMSVLAYPGNYGNQQTYDADRGTVTTSDWTWLQAGSDWLKVTPFGIRRLLKFIKEEYGNPQVLITENGVSDQGPFNLNDTLRQHFYTEYINQVLKAYLLDGVDVIGYTAWSVMDNLEWASGYTETFGLFYVNRSDPALPRTPKVSVQTYNRIIRCNGFPDPNSGHECLNPTQPPTEPPIVPVPPPGVNFLGLDLTFEEAETGLNVTFALLLVTCVCALLGGGGVFVTRRRRNKRRPEQSRATRVSEEPRTSAQPRATVEPRASAQPQVTAAPWTTAEPRASAQARVTAARDDNTQF